MLRKPSFPIVALISLLIFLLTGQAGVQGYVWCVGEDGHAALEYAAGNACGPAAQPQEAGSHRHDHDEERIAFAPEGDHCGPCLDLPASLDAASRRAEDRQDLAATGDLPATGIRVPLPAMAGTADPGLFAQPPPRIPQAILFHRTVVLLN